MLNIKKYRQKHCDSNESDIIHVKFWDKQNKQNNRKKRRNLRS